MHCFPASFDAVQVLVHVLGINWKQANSKVPQAGFPSRYLGRYVAALNDAGLPVVSRLLEMAQLQPCRAARNSPSGLHFCPHHRKHSPAFLCEKPSRSCAGKVACTVLLHAHVRTRTRARAHTHTHTHTLCGMCCAAVGTQCTCERVDGCSVCSEMPNSMCVAAVHGKGLPHQDPLLIAHTV